MDKIVPLSRQQVYDNALFGIRKQGYKKSYELGSCMYFTLDGLRCGFGHSIPPEMEQEIKQRGLNSAPYYKIINRLSGMEALFSAVPRELVAAVQSAHDCMWSAADFEHRMEEVAAGYSLVYTPPAQ